MPLSKLTRALVLAIQQEHPQLESLNLSHNELRELQHLELLRSLQQLDASHNQLLQLPASLGEMLPCLTYLNVNANHITSLEPLASCLSLRMLEMAENAIELVSELVHLQGLMALESVVLEGNPIAQRATYRREVVQMLPQVKELDHREISVAERLSARFAWTGNAPSVRNGIQNVDDSRSDPGSLAMSDSEPRLLTPQLLVDASSHRAESEVGMSPRHPARNTLDSQCNTASENAAEEKEVQRHGTSYRFPQIQTMEKGIQATDLSSQDDAQLVQCRIQALESILAIYDTSMMNAIEQKASLTHEATTSVDVARIPRVYMKLLSTWRMKVMQLLVQHKSMELTSAGEKRQAIEERSALFHQQKHLQSTLEIWKQKCTDLEAQRSLLTSQLDQMQRKQQVNGKKIAETIKMMQDEKQRLLSLADLISSFAATDGVMCEPLEVMNNAMKTLAVYEARLESLVQRVHVLTGLLNSRHAHLRNSMAALEVERRLMRSCSTSNRAHQSHAEKSKQQTMCEKPIWRLRPATEAALRCIFNRLDPYQTGLVRVNRMMQALKSDPDVIQAVKTPERRARLVDYVEKALDSRVIGKRCGTITWGEFMLLFVPQTELEETVIDAWVVAEESDVGLPAFEFDYDIRSLPKQTKRGRDDGERRTEELRREDLIKEMRRIRHDRDSLRHELFEHARLLSRRAVLIQNEWQLKVNELSQTKDELQREIIRENDEVKRLREALAIAERGQSESKHELSALRRELTMQRSTMEGKLQDMKRTHEQKVQDEQELWRKEMQDVSFSFSNLKYENTKQEQTIRHLEREIAKLRDQAVAQESQRVNHLNEKLSRRDDEIAKLRRERNSLLNSLRDLERKLSVMEKAPAPVETRDVCSQTCQPAVVRTINVEVQTEWGETLPSRAPDPMAANRPMSLAEISTENGRPRPPRVNHSHLHAVDRRLDELESLAQDLLAD